MPEIGVDRGLFQPAVHIVAQPISPRETVIFAAPVMRSMLGPLPSSHANMRCWALDLLLSRSRLSIVPAWRTEDVVSVSAVPATNCELACTESCECVSSLTPLGEDIMFNMVTAQENFLQKIFQNCSTSTQNSSRCSTLVSFLQSPSNTPIPKSQNSRAWSASDKEFVCQLILVPNCFA